MTSKNLMKYKVVLNSHFIYCIDNVREHIVININDISYFNVQNTVNKDGNISSYSICFSLISLNNDHVYWHFTEENTRNSIYYNLLKNIPKTNISVAIENYDNFNE